MSTVKVTCLVISCDRCGLKLGESSTDAPVRLPADVPYENSGVWREEDWRKVGDRDLDPNCWTYGEPAGTGVIVELPHPLSRRVGA
ncbi:hypothetical protein ACWEQG_01650 [Microbispora sp. NPDC004025]